MIYYIVLMYVSINKLDIIEILSYDEEYVRDKYASKFLSEIGHNVNYNFVKVHNEIR